MEGCEFNQAMIDDALAKARALRRLGQSAEVRDAIEALCAAVGEMKAAQQRQREFFESAPMAYLHTDRYGLVTDVNAAAASLLHADRARLIGRPFLELIASPDRRRFRPNIGRLIENPGREEWETRLLVEGSLLTVSVAILCQMLCGDGGYLWAIRDLRELRRAQNEAADGSHGLVDAESTQPAEHADEGKRLRERLGNYLPTRGGR